MALIHSDEPVLRGFTARQAAIAQCIDIYAMSVADTYSLPISKRPATKQRRKRVSTLGTVHELIRLAWLNVGTYM
ncbi:hypothetical protein [Octadecabacter dasysiphoniae]|uniref:hypothetical protein n=1 Tax=Octadecabacter dasysiphoniae TaxID=2909341 RepID=UPI001F2E99C7|nr:hypothetical protein [Octadecabacter dasysiphoniae]